MYRYFPVEKCIGYRKVFSPDGMDDKTDLFCYPGFAWGTEDGFPLYSCLLPPHEKCVKIGQGQLGPGRSAVIALVCTFRGFHLAEEGIHFRNRQDTVGTDGIVTGDGCQQFVSFFPGDPGGSVFMQITKNVVHDCRDIGLF